MNTYRIPRFWWLWLPLIFMALQLCMEAFLPGHVMFWMMAEDGPHEDLQAMTILIGFCVGLAILRRFSFRDNPWLGAWVVLATICCFYVAGEEISWGQWIFRWHTPKYWAHINDQNETNLHNTSSWLDQKPRAILELGTIVGGLIIPALNKWRRQWLPARFAIIYPPAILAVTAGVYAFFKLSNVIGHHVFHINLYQRVAEVTELCMYYFVTLYMIVLKGRIFEQQTAPAVVDKFLG